MKENPSPGFFLLLKVVSHNISYTTLQDRTLETRGISIPYKLSQFSVNTANRVYWVDTKLIRDKSHHKRVKISFL